MEDIRPYQEVDEERREEPEVEQFEFTSDDEVPFEIPRD